MKLIFVSLMVGILEILFLDTASALRVCPSSVQECQQRGGHQAPRCDTDSDGLFDVDEDANGNCICDLGETCWLQQDTDNDCIRDGVEVNTHTDPINFDTDGDHACDGNVEACPNVEVCGRACVCCIPGEDRNCNGIVDGIVHGIQGIGVTESDPRVADTDGDGLSDGVESSFWWNGCNREEEDLSPLYSNPTDADTDNDGLTDYREMHSRRGGTQADPQDPDTDHDGIIDGQDPCPCDPSPACTPPPQPVCTNGDAGDAPAVGSTTEIRLDSEVLRSEKDACLLPRGRQRPDVLKEYYCDPQSGQIMLHWYICKPSAPGSSVGCTTNAQGFGSCPASDAHLVTDPRIIDAFLLP